MKVLIIGLPLFTERLVNQLRASGDGNHYLRFDTYYNMLDKLKFWFHLNSADLVYSINGAIFGSRAFEMTLNKGRKLVIHWVGTDVIKAKKDFDNGLINKSIIEDATHFCEVDWIQQELKKIGIKAKTVNFFSFDKKVELSPFPDQFTVLTYIGEGREEFYGIKEIYSMAKSLPDVQVDIVGINAYSLMEKPDNVRLLGWVDDMDKKMEQAMVCVRMAEHDGLSAFVLEALSRGRYVVYRFAYPECKQAVNADELRNQIELIKGRYNQSALELNKGGVALIEQHFSSDFILRNLVEEFNKVI